MSRKRTSTHTAEPTHTEGEPCPGHISEYDYRYYRPGCYCTPQIAEQTTPYHCAYLHEYLPQWNICSPATATYIVDAFGMVYYFSDFEHQLQLSSDMPLYSEISYRYCGKNELEYQLDEDDDEEAVSPRKRERFDCENDDIEEDVKVVEVVEDKQQEENLINVDTKTPWEVNVEGSVYRSKEGYLVEEPREQPDTQES